jgi:hypothetical protein
MKALCIIGHTIPLGRGRFIAYEQGRIYDIEEPAAGRYWEPLGTALRKILGTDFKSVPNIPSPGTDFKSVPRNEETGILGDTISRNEGGNES